MTRPEVKQSSIQTSPTLLREIHTEEPTKILVFFPDGKHMIQVSLEGAIQLRTSDGQTMGSFMAMPDVNACAISRDARWFVAAHDVSVTIWDVTTQKKVCEHDCVRDPLLSGKRTPTTSFTALDISPDSSRVAIGDSTGSIVLLGIPTGEQLAVFKCDRGLYLDSLRFSQAGDCLAIGTAGKISDGRVTTPATLHVWQVSSGDQLTRQLEIPFGSFDKEAAWSERLIVVDWLHSGQRILVGSRRFLVVVDVLTKSTECKNLPSFQALSSDDHFILSTATSNQSSLGTYFWDPTTFTELGFSIPGHLPLAVSPDSTLIATFPLIEGSDSSNVIFIWSVY